VKIAWSRSAASGPDAAAWTAAASVSALISACWRASVRWATAISCSAAILACSAAWRALASAIEADEAQDEEDGHVCSGEKQRWDFGSYPAGAGPNQEEGALPP
jgi:hypothetical protein